MYVHNFGSEKIQTLTAAIVTSESKPKEPAVRDLTPTHNFSPPPKSQTELKLQGIEIKEVLKDLKNVRDGFFQDKGVLAKGLKNQAELSQSR